MDSEMYSLLALAARYFFSGLMVLIVFRAWRLTVTDNRRARQLRDMAESVGCVGELVLRAGKRRESYPVPREGVLGSSRSADVVIPHKGVYRYHAHLERMEGGILLRPLGSAPVALGPDRLTGARLFVRDGDEIFLGGLRLTLILYDEEGMPVRADYPVEEDGAEEEMEEDDFFMEDAPGKKEDKTWREEKRLTRGR